MRLFDFFTRRSSTRSEIDEANAALLAAAEESLDATLTLAKLQLREKVKMWDLENPSLLNLLPIFITSCDNICHTRESVGKRNLLIAYD